MTPTTPTGKAGFLHPAAVTFGSRTLRCEYRDDALAGSTLHEVCDLVGPRGRRATVVYDRTRDRFTLLGARLCPLAEERATLDAAFRVSN